MARILVSVINLFSKDLVFYVREIFYIYLNLEINIEIKRL